MALTRSMLKGLELTDEQVSKIITAHTETVEGLKEVNSDLEKQLKEAKEAASRAGTTGQDWEAKYNSLNQELEDLKHQQEVEKEQGEKKAAYKSLLKEIGVDEKRINSILKLAPLDDIELAKDGHIKGSEKLSEQLAEEWSDFIVSTSTKGENVGNPPSNTTGKMTKEEIMKIKDATERQKAIAENPQAFAHAR